MAARDALVIIGGQVQQLPAGDTLNGAAGSSATVLEINVGTTPKWTGKFLIVDAAITALKRLLIWQAPGPYTGKGTLADEAEMDAIQFFPQPAAGSAIVRWQTVPMVACNVPFGARDPFVTSTRIGRIRGNFKCAYLVLS